MTARDDRVDARVVRVGPRLPPGARVRVRSMRDDDASKISLATRDYDDDATRDDASAPRADDVVTIAHYGWRARRVEDDAIVRLVQKHGTKRWAVIAQELNKEIPSVCRSGAPPAARSRARA